MSTATAGGQKRNGKSVRELDSAAVRFVGDSGDGMQLAGTQFTNTSAVFGNDVSTLPDFPAEIRAPAGTIAGVSGFQINFSNHDIHTPGDKVDALIAMNPASLKANVGDLEDGGILVVNVDEFTKQNLAKAKYTNNPLEDGSLKNFRVFEVPITRQTVDAVKQAGVGAKDAERCKNFYALGLIFWLYDRPLDVTLRWINDKFSKKPEIAAANTLAIQAGFNFGETAEMFPVRYRVNRAKLDPGKYRNITGNQATALGLITAARLAGKTLVYGTYPITPASDILHELSMRKNFDVRTYQAEDEIAAFAAVVGAAYSGALAVTASSGPGIALKQEGVGLAVMTELPCLIVNVQRGGPSTGLPTKTEQADLWQAILGRNGECPLPVIAAQSPADCFWTVIEATRWAFKYMTPVFVLTDGFLANGSEPWRIPAYASIEKITVRHASDAATFQPYLRDKNGARPWAVPGTPGLEHRVGGLEKADVTGNVSYDADNHHKMVGLRAQKVANIVHEIPPQPIDGPDSGDVLLVSWGGTYGAVRTAGQRARAKGRKVSHVHLRHMNPFPANLGEIVHRFKHVLVCELNMGQLLLLLRGRYAVEAVGLNKVQGRPFMIREITAKIDEVLGAK
ncbi:MAG: 2-oxoglutarate oxidoreductase subunit KorA [Phycisphaerae bacterium]|nr:2-oxoglutarate oxidoreductase subunit KorA [Phycisphaerae bacterium]